MSRVDELVLLLQNALNDLECKFDKGQEHVNLFKEAGIVRNMHCDDATIVGDPQKELEWICGQLIDMVESGQRLGMASWINTSFCYVDKYKECK